MAAIDTDRLDELAEDDDYPHVVGGDTAADYALDHVYAAIDEQITDEGILEELAMVPAGYLRGAPDADDVRLILNEIDSMVGGNDEVSQAIEEAREFTN